MQRRSIHPLTLAREAYNLTQPQLAMAVKLSVKTISKAENNQPIGAYSRGRLCKYFKKTAQELGLISRHTDTDAQFNSASLTMADADEKIEKATCSAQIQEDAGADLSSSLLRGNSDVVAPRLSQPTQQRIIPAVHEPGGQVMNRLRRQILGVTGATIVTSHTTLFGLDLAERLLHALNKPSTIDEITLSQLEALARDCWGLQPDIIGLVSHDLLQYVLGHLQTVTEFLEMSLLPSTRLRLLSVTAELAQVIAQMYSHVGDKLTAEKYFLISLETAKGASNDAMQAVCMGNMSFLPLYNGQESNVLQALPLLQEAQRHAANHAVIRSWLAAREAEVYSYLNDEYHSLKALENATTVRSDMTSRGNPDEDGYWTCYDHLLQVGYQGGCYLRLHLLKDAEMTLEQAVNEFSTARIYQQPYILIDLATALSRQGNLEKACTVVEKALLVTSQTHSPSHMKHILSFRDQMVQWNEEPCVKRLDEQLFAMQYH